MSVPHLICVACCCVVFSQPPKVLACSLHSSTQPRPNNCTIPGAVIVEFGNTLSVSVRLAGSEFTNVADDLQVFYG